MIHVVPRAGVMATKKDSRQDTLVSSGGNYILQVQFMEKRKNSKACSHW